MIELPLTSDVNKDSVPKAKDRDHKAKDETFEYQGQGQRSQDQGRDLRVSRSRTEVTRYMSPMPSTRDVKVSGKTENQS